MKPKKCSGCFRLLIPGLDPPGKSCKRCVEARNRRKRSLEQKNLCSTCGQAPRLAPTTRCELCYFKDRAQSSLGDSSLWNALREKLHAQQFKCVYSGELLVLGVNCEVDHRYPVSRYPELRSEISNVDWVAKWVNQMKGPFTPDEFLANCERLIKYSAGI